MILTALGTCGGFPDKDKATSGYFVETDSKLVFDLGSNTLNRLLKLVDVKNIDALFLTHYHYDHITDLFVLRYLPIFSTGFKLNVYIPKSEQEEAKLISKISEFNVHFVDVGDEITINNTKVLVGPAEHIGKCVGYKIVYDSTLYYTGDTRLNDEVVSFAKGSNAILCDTFIDTERYEERLPHMCVEQAKRLCKESDSILLATHVRPDFFYKVLDEVGEDNMVEEMMPYIIER